MNNTKSAESVDLPQPLVPHSRTVTDSFLSLILHQIIRTFKIWLCEVKQHIDDIFTTYMFLINGKKNYLHARIKSALWSWPTYLYSARASQTTFTNVSLKTTTVVRFLYISNGLLLLLSSASLVAEKLTLLTFSTPSQAEGASTAFPNTDSFPCEGESINDPSLLINSKALRLICSQPKKKKHNLGSILKHGAFTRNQRRLWKD